MHSQLLQVNNPGVGLPIRQEEGTIDHSILGGPRNLLASSQPSTG